MKKLVRKWLSMLLAVTMLFGAFTVLPNTITADAASNYLFPVKGGSWYIITAIQLHMADGIQE